MATADSFEHQCWNEICEDVECDDTNYHATVEELMARIQRVSDNCDAIDEAEDIVLQAELRIENEE